MSPLALVSDTKPTTTSAPVRKRQPKAKSTTAIARKAGVVEQVRVALSPEHRLATFLGALLGAFVPFATFMIAHHQVNTGAYAYGADPKLLLVLGGLVYSARTVLQWGRLALDSGIKAIGFTVLIEGVMVASSAAWLSIVALVYLCLINAIATGVTLARGAPQKSEA